MRKLMKKGMLILGTMILVLHAFLLPVGIVYAETTDKKEGGQVQEEEQLELPSIKNYLEVEKEGNPRFSFPRSRLQGTVEEPLKLTFVSDQEVSEAKITLPKEAKLVKDQLQAGVTVNQEEESDEWTIQAERAQQTFVLPVVFESEGNYEVSIEEATATLEISEKEETEIEDQSEMNQKSSDESNEEHVQDVNATEQSEEKEAPVATEESNEESIPSKNKTFEKTVFEGNTAEVATMAAFREAVANPEVGIISVQENLTETTANIMTIDRPIKIQGNGHTLTFGNNSFYFQLAEVSEPTTFRIENATITKVGATPLVNATTQVSRNWVLEIEDVAEINANTMRLASMPEGTIIFTGGNSNFTRIISSAAFIEAKEVKAVNKAQVTISRGNMTIFFSSAIVSAPKLVVEAGSAITIMTTGGTANTIDLRGDQSEIALQTNGKLSISTFGTPATPSITTNNTIILSGANPKISVNSASKLTVTSTAAKRGLYLSGNNPKIIVVDSELSVTSATHAAISLIGSEPLFSATKSNSDIRSTTGATLALAGDSPKVYYEGGTGSFTSTTGQRLNLIGDNPQLSLNQTQFFLTATTGRGVYLQGIVPQVLMNESSIEMTDTDPSQAMILQGTDALLSLRNKSEMYINGGGTGTLENIAIGDNNARPELSVTGGSKLSVTTSSATRSPTDTLNNAIHLRGVEPKINITSGSELKVSVTSNARRGLYLNGTNAEVNLNDSHLDINTISGRALNLNGESSTLNANKSNLKLNTAEGAGISLSGHNSVVNAQSSLIDFSGATGYGVEIAGNKPKFLSSDSEINIKNMRSANGVTLNGQNSFLELTNNSQMSIDGGNGIHENILIGNGNANPSLKVTDNSNLSIRAQSTSNTAAIDNNNSIRIAGSSPILEVSKNSKISIDVLSGGPRSIFMNGESANLKVENNSEIISKNLYGTSIGMSTTNAQLTVDNFSKIDIESSARRNNSLIDITTGSNDVYIRNNSSIASKHVEFDNPGTNTRALSMSGSNNNIIITSGGNLNLNNRHYTNRPNSGSVSSNYSTIYLGNGENNFSIDNNSADRDRSQLRLTNDYAAALYSDGGHLKFNQKADTIFYAEGSSINTREWGVFVAQDTMEFNVHSPYYFDFKNVRKDGGDIFGTKNGSSLNITDTFFSAWATGSKFDDDPKIGFFEKIDVAYEGRDFVSASSSNNLNLTDSLPGLSGRVSRISANNSAPILDGVRQPTNADKSFIAEFSYKEGLDDIREAGTDEITVEIKVTDPDNNSNNYTASTVGNESPIQTWEEKENNALGKAGRVSFEFENLLKEGTIIEFVSISRGMKEGGISLSQEELEKIRPITVMNVTPPELVDFGHFIELTTETTSIKAFPNQINIPGNNALLYINNQHIATQKVGNDGSFSFELNTKLNESDKVQVLMEDNQGGIIDTYSTITSVFKRPETNNDNGNRNPQMENYKYHDAVFPSARTYIVELASKVSPVDPLSPGIKVEPENPPVLSENQGKLSIDFVSRFTFGQQGISTRTQNYYAQPQRLLNENGIIDEKEERPNYVQISDRRPGDTRNGWVLSVTQNGQFADPNDHKLKGASLQLTNQQLASIQETGEPELNETDRAVLLPGVKTKLLTAKDGQGEETWIYRFGDRKNAGESVVLEVPPRAAPKATTYQTTLTWELSMVPNN
ncbi:WxL domain-containing protein [Enterococcus sp. DIV0806c]|uniref:WxL domain-containing protein n=1 Tax=unclassified Enterococcus TaxID=2608891 RepID=UPI003F25060A